MWLISTSSGCLQEFIGRNVPKYGILSHTWGEEEVSFRDMEDGRATSKKGYQKIEMMSRLARQAGLDYAWIDTCCIDKSSSAELSESINSMHRWYGRAEICFAYLSDLDESGDLNDTLPHCRWFTRGWTLQELIAPKKLIFYDQGWNPRGSKEDLLASLSSITSIDVEVLRHERPLSVVPVAEKMAWAAHRETTRTEDIAYCLLGIFDLNMPLLYGEDEKAFRRLQEEIIKSTADLTIFAWTLDPATKSESQTEGPVFCGVLASSPLAFSRTQALTKTSMTEQRELSVSNIGIRTSAPMICLTKGLGLQYFLPLARTDHAGKTLSIKLRKCGVDRYVREDPWTIERVGNRSSALDPTCFVAANERHLLTALPELKPSAGSPQLAMGFSIAQTRSHVLQLDLPRGIFIDNSWSLSQYDEEDRVFLCMKTSNGIL